MRKYCRVGQATDDNMAHGFFIMDTEVYKYALIICNTYCFKTASMVTRKAPHCHIVLTLRQIRGDETFKETNFTGVFLFLIYDDYVTTVSPLTK